jgi:hypothetical protein
MPRAQPPWSRSQKAQLAATVFAVFLLAIYAVVAVFAQPVTGTVEEPAGGLSQLPGYPANVDTGLYHLYAYVDGGTFTVTKWVTNSGFVPLTITGVDPAPDYWVGLLGVKDARQGVPLIPGKCCAIDEAATWSAPSFRPLQLNPGQSGAVSIRYLMSHCEDNDPGGTVSSPVFRLQYNILGFPRDVEIPWSFPVGVTSPDTCPRIGPARPVSG